MELTQIFINRPDLLDDEKKLKSIFSDFYAGDNRKVNRMMKAYEIGIFTSLVSGKNSDIEKSKLINKLVDIHDMQEDKAEEAINDWFSLCNNQVILAYKKYLNEKQQKIKKQLNEEVKKKCCATMIL